MDGQSLFDTLAGAAGAPVNRAGLNAYVANSQAINGLRTAQTEDALLRATKAQQEQDARAQLGAKLGDLFGPGHEAEAQAATNFVISGAGTAEQAMQAVKTWQEIHNRGILGDTAQLGTPAQTAAQQGVQGKVAEPVTVPENYTTLPGAYTPDVQQTPQGIAHTADLNASARLRDAQAAHPEQFHPSIYGNMEMPDSLKQAVAEHRLDPSRINSRNVRILAQIAENTPGYNFNQDIADAALQRNPTFHAKTLTMETLPETLSSMVEAGKAVNYDDLKIAGMMKKWMLGQVNDPALTRYMTIRNDSLLALAGTMRSVSMSDQAHQAEIEAANPTLSPAALDAWYKGQMDVLGPRLARVEHVAHLGETPAPGGPGAVPPVTPAATIPPAAASQLKDGVITHFGNGQSWTLKDGKPVQVP